MSSEPLPRPLDGITVLDFTRILAGPFCTMMLGDLGADVIKIERPGKGDDTRRWGPPFVGDESGYFLSVNRNKRSLTLDLRSARGLEIALSLVDRADVVVHNFRPGVADKLGVGYEALSARKPDLVYCTVSGFGLDGPYAARAGYDALVQGMGGMMSITGEPDGSPTKVGVAIIDVVTGLFALNGVLAALVARERHGRGEHVDVALLDSAVAILVNQAQSYLITDQNPRRLGNAHPSIVPYETFFAADGPFIVAVGNDTQFARLCRIIERPELSDDPRFVDNPSRVRNRDELIPMLAERFVTAERARWLAALEAENVPGGPINSLDDVFADPQVAARKMARAVEHPSLGALRLVGTPIKLRRSQGADVVMRAPPLLGEHSDEVLADKLGLDEAAIAALRDEGVIQ